MLNRFSRTTILALILFASLPALSHAQEVIAPTSLAARQLLEESVQPGLRLGKFDLYPRATAMVLYDDNIFLNGIVKESDLIWSIAPGASLMLGEPGERSLTLEYSPNILFFTDHTQFDTVDHTARLRGTWPFSRLTLGFSQDFAQASSVVLGYAGRVEHRSFNTSLTSRYEVSDKTSVEVNGRQTFTDYQGTQFINSREWANDDWVNYLIPPKLSLGGGFTFGYLDLERYPHQIYERLSVRAVYTATGKLDLNASVGGERREYSGASSANYYPVFSVGAVYHPTALMTINLNAYRQEQNSVYLADQNYLSTGFSASVRHVLLERFVASLTGSYYNSEYHRNFGSFSSTLSYDSFSVRPWFDWLISRGWRAGVFYAYRQNLSEVNFYDYTSNQVGMQASWAF
jgi:Putative beta-barrel porin 2